MSAEIDFVLSEKQKVAFNSLATEILYGGAAGGGKSFLMRAVAITWCTEIPGLARPFIIGPHGKLGFLEGGALEEKIYRRTDRPSIGGSRRRDDGSGRVPQAQRV